MHWLRATLTAVLPTRTGQTSGQIAPLPCPDPPVCVIGDLHGRLDLLDRILDRIAAQITDSPGHADARLVFVGDMIDRGPDSAGVLARLRALQRSAPARIICLMGNHERMMLDFLADPARHGPRWIAAGGAETLTSFGLSPFARNHGTGAWDLLAAELRRRLTPDVIDWLGTLPLLWRDGALVVTHAGADPDLPIDAQAPRRLLWGARHPERSPRADGLWVAHGHTITSVPHARAGRISVDTGAWRNGTLSAAWMDASGLLFFDVSDKN